MAEYVWLNLFQKGSGYLPFSFWVDREDAIRSRAQAGSDCIGTQRYRVEERDGTRVLVYDPEPKYEQRDSLLVDEIRKGQYGFFEISREQAAELVAKHRQSEASR